MPTRSAIVSVALHTPSHSGVGDLLSYTSDLPLPPGTLVRVPLGQREVLGVVWDAEQATGELPEGAALRPVAGVLEGVDPHCWRYVADEGTESLPGRLAGGEFAVAPDAGLDVWMEQALATADECRTCAFLQNCGGYFKWPHRDYACAGVKRLFGELREAAAELRRDLASAPTD